MSKISSFWSENDNSTTFIPLWLTKYLTLDLFQISQKDFVNRLIMNQIDGKLVEIEASSAEKELLAMEDLSSVNSSPVTEMITTS